MKRPVLSVLLLAAPLALFATTGCDRKPGGDDAGTTEYRIPHPDELEEREDGKFYLKGEATPFSGVVVRTHPERGMRYLAMYQGGLLNGPEVTWRDNGIIRRISDFRDGEKDRQREWHENGFPWRDAWVENDLLGGRHLKWHENGRLGFVGAIYQDEKSGKWDGHITDHDENGELIVDAIFEMGKYVGGVFPLAKNPRPKPSGSKWVWETGEEEPRRVARE